MKSEDRRTWSRVGARVPGALLLTWAAATGVRWLVRWLAGKEIRRALKSLMTEPYEENLWELVSAGKRTGPQNIVETNLRAQEGQAILRPLGPPRTFPDFSGLMFNIAQLSTLPTPGDARIDTGVVLGKAARRPLRLDIPLLVSGMAYGLALSERTKIAIAKGTALAGTATNTGEGPLLTTERAAARSLIIQYNRGTWTKAPQLLRQADMIEIQFGQGAIGGVAHVMHSQDIDPLLRKRLGLAPGEDAVIQARHPGVEGAAGLRRLVKYLKRETGGVPVGVKLGAGHQIERDLSIALEAGVDVIALDGAQAATRGSAPALQDSCGLPTLFALCRGARFLEREGARRDVSLIVSGGLVTPEDFLKALALGADAVYIGTIALFALSHTQVLKTVPFEPPTQLVYHGGKYEKKLNVEKAANHLAGFLTACAQEMAEVVRILGKTALSELTRDDLCALDTFTAQVTGVAPAWHPYG